jgi:glycosyltransferase involved in cell wall biosynthesis
VYAGRILSLKNLHLAVAAFREVLKRYPNLSGRIRFDIYGEGPYLPVCREMAGDETGSSIFFHGFIDRKVLIEKLKSAHLFIHLSVKDTAATAPMEAMALGLPVICVNCGGMGNMVDSGCGILLDPSSPGHIIEGSIIAISELFGDRERLLNLSLNARQKIERSFTWESRAEQYNQILQKNWKDV